MAFDNAFSIAGKKTVITGGTAGIGLGVARHFVNEGAQVVITGRRETGESIAAEIDARFVRMDVAAPTSVTEGTATAAEILGGRIDVLVLNAGVSPPTGMIEDTNLDAFRWTFDVNVFGVVQGIKEGVQYMHEGGRIIITSSPAGSVFVAGLSAYSASKAAVDVVTKTAAIELAPKGILVNAVLPGIAKTDMSFNDEAAGIEIIRVLTQTGAVREPEEYGPTFQFLASAAGALFSGAVVGCDDGISAGYSAELWEKAFGAAGEFSSD